jgi:hypothetical protein
MTIARAVVHNNQPPLRLACAIKIQKNKTTEVLPSGTARWALDVIRRLQSQREHHDASGGKEND